MMAKSDLKISLIQMDIAWEQPARNRELLGTKIAELRGKQHVIVLPEMFNTGFTLKAEQWAEPINGETITWMQEQARQSRSILTGSLIVKEEGKYYNRLVWVLPDGSVAHYDKRHLFSYAGEQVDFEPGEKRVIARVNGWKICLQICYDLRFPVWARNTDEYDILLYVANWPEKRNYAWETLLSARAIENMSYVIGVNRVGEDGNGHQYIGNSSIYSPLGGLIAKAGPGEEIITHTLDHSQITDNRSKFPFLDDRDHFMLL
jgi:omega-amidase